MNVTVLPNGDLKLSADNHTRAYIADAMRQKRARSYWSIMAEMFEPYFTNGGFEHFDAGQADPFVGLTSAPCVAEALIYTDDGRREIDGRLWYFADYMIRGDLEELRDRGRVVYQLA